MRRSEVNQCLRQAKEFFAACSFALPAWAEWSLAEWRRRQADCREIVDGMLGWDITDFGSDDFARRGLLLFTLRNGTPDNRKPYAEKVMIVEEEQETPFHFHWSKIEDIINRGGGNLIIELFNAGQREEIDRERPVTVSIDGIRRQVSAGTPVRLAPGESICLDHGLYHRFYGEPGRGPILVGEVSAVNDDRTDNRFLEQVGRFPPLVEDEEPLHLLAFDYASFLDNHW